MEVSLSTYVLVVLSFVFGSIYCYVLYILGLTGIGTGDPSCVDHSIFFHIWFTMPEHFIYLESYRLKGADEDEAV